MRALSASHTQVASRAQVRAAGGARRVALRVRAEAPGAPVKENKSLLKELSGLGDALGPIGLTYSGGIKVRPRLGMRGGCGERCAARRSSDLLLLLALSSNAHRPFPNRIDPQPSTPHCYVYHHQSAIPTDNSPRNTPASTTRKSSSPPRAAPTASRPPPPPAAQRASRA